MLTMTVSAIYQLEILDPLLELVSRSDVTAHLAIAVEQLREHFSLERLSVRVEVRRDLRGELEGIGFFHPVNGDLLAHITAFYLDREDCDSVPQAVKDALRSRRQLESALQKLFDHEF